MVDVVADYSSDYQNADGVLFGTLQPRQPSGADVPNTAYKPTSLTYTQRLDSAAFRSSAFAALIFTASTGGMLPLPGYEFTAADGKTRYKIVTAERLQAGSAVRCLMKEIQ